MVRRAVLLAAAMASVACASVVAAQTITPSAPSSAPPAAWNNTSQQALETAQPGTAVPWQNPDGSTGGAITPSPAFQDAAGETCREFQQTVTVNGQPQQAFGTACRQPDGTWRLQPAPPSAVGQPQPAVAYALPPAYYYPAPFYAPVFFGYGCCFFHHHHDHDHGHGHHH